MRKHITELSGLVNGHLLLDFQKAAYAQLELELDGRTQDLAEVVIAEYAKDDQVVHVPGWRTFKINDIRLSPDQKLYRFHIPEHRGAYGAIPHIETPPEFGGEIAVFRYVEINHYYGPAKVRRIEFYNDAPEDAAHFESSDKKLNQIWEFCKYSLLATSIFPCYVDGERERMPYEGDTYITQLGHFCCGADYSIAEHTIDHFMANGKHTWPTEWLLLTPLLARDYWLYSGNQKALERWMPELPAKTLPHLLREDGLLVPKGKIRDIIDWPEEDRDNYEFGETNFVPNAYRYEALKTLSEMAENNNYNIESKQLMSIVRRTMFKNGLFVDNPDSAHTSLHTALFALRFGLLKPAEIPAHQAILRERGMACSVYAAQFLLESCFMTGLDDLGIQLLTNDGPRSWFNMMREGSTISMEAWGEFDKPHQDWSHPWGAAPANIIPRFVVGVRPTAPGFVRFVVKPSPAAPERFVFRQPTPWGAIEIRKDSTDLKVSLSGTERQLHQEAPGEFAVSPGSQPPLSDTILAR